MFSSFDVLDFQYLNCYQLPRQNPNTIGWVYMFKQLLVFPFLHTLATIICQYKALLSLLIATTPKLLQYSATPYKLLLIFGANNCINWADGRTSTSNSCQELQLSTLDNIQTLKYNNITNFNKNSIIIVSCQNHQFFTGGSLSQFQPIGIEDTATNRGHWPEVTLKAWSQLLPSG